MADQSKANESGSSEGLGAQPNQGASGRPNTNPEQLFQGRSEVEQLCYLVHDCFPEDMDLTRPVVKQFTTHGLLTTVIFERFP